MLSLHIKNPGDLTNPFRPAHGPDNIREIRIIKIAFVKKQILFQDKFPSEQNAENRYSGNRIIAADKMAEYLFPFPIALPDWRGSPLPTAEISLS